MGGKNRAAKLVERIASELLRANGLTYGNFEGEYYAQQLAEVAWRPVWKRITHFRAETLGLIASYGNGNRIDVNGRPLPSDEFRGTGGPSLYHVHCSTWLGKYEDGLSLLRQIACTVIIGKMALILREDRCRAEEEEELSALTRAAMTRRAKRARFCPSVDEYSDWPEDTSPV